MLTDGDLAAPFKRRRVEQQHPGTAPERDEQRASIWRDRARVRLRGEIDRPQHVTGLQIHDADDLAHHVRREQSRSVGSDCEPTDEALWDRFGTIRSGTRDFHRPAEHQIRPARQPQFRRTRRRVFIRVARQRGTDAPAQFMNRVVPRARHVQASAVRMPGKTQPRVIEHQHIPHPLRLDVDDGDRRLHVAVRRDEQQSAVGRFDHRERQAAHLDVAARRRNLPSVREKGDTSAQRAGTKGNRHVAVRRNQDGENGRQRERQDPAGSQDAARRHNAS